MPAENTNYRGRQILIGFQKDLVGNVLSKAIDLSAFAEEGRRSAMGKVNDNIRNGFSIALARRESGLKADLRKVVWAE